MDSQVEEIKTKTDIVELIGQSVKLTRAGRNFKGLCPFHHEQTPSFMVSPERGTWRCFGCGEAGDALTFLQKYENISFPEALEQLAKRAGIQLQRRKQDPTQQQANQRLFDLLQLSSEYYQFMLEKHELGKVAREYLEKRQVKSETSKKFKLGYAPDSWQSIQQFLQKRGFKPSEIRQAGMSSQSSSGREFDKFRGRLMFPISDSLGRIVGFSGRSLSDDKDSPKYLNSPEGPLFHKGRLLFGLSQAREAIRATGRVVLVEGNVDLLSSHQAGIAEVVAPLGTALTSDQVSSIKRFTQNIVLAYDNDKAGIQAILRSLPIIQEHQLHIRVVTLPYGKDPDECITHNPADWRRAIDQSAEVFDFMLQYSNQTFDLRTGSGKQQAAEVIMPFIRATKDIIEQNFIIHQAADVIGTDEEILRQQSKQASQNTPTTARKETNRTSSNTPKHPVSHQQLLADYLIATLLTTMSDELPRKSLLGLVDELNSQSLPENHQHIWKVITDNIVTGDAKLALEQLSHSLSGEAQELFDRLSLTNTDKIASVASRGTIPEQLLQTAIQLNSLHLKSQLTQLTEQLKRASILDSNEAKDLKQKFTQITKEYNDYSKRLEK